MNLYYSGVNPSDAPTNSDDLLTGGNGGPPAIGETPQQNTQFSMKDFLGSLGSAAKSVSTAARDIGTAVGTVQGTAKQAEIDYKNAKVEAASPTISSKLRQWWNFSSTNDKIIAGLGVAGVIVAIVQLNKK